MSSALPITPSTPAPILAPAFDRAWSLQDVQSHLGDIPLSRIRAVPGPGTAGEADLEAYIAESGIPSELIDGVIVEKAVGNSAANATVWLIYYLVRYLEQNDVGFALSPEGLARVLPGNIRSPDVSFIAWKHFPDRIVPNILPFAPDLAVEILSPSNTVKEMVRKRAELFAAGTRLMWIVEPELPQVEVYTSATEPPVKLHHSDTLTGGDVLPGFELSIQEWFSRVIRRV